MSENGDFGVGIGCGGGGCGIGVGGIGCGCGRFKKENISHDVGVLIEFVLMKIFLEFEMFVAENAFPRAKIRVAGEMTVVSTLLNESCAAVVTDMGHLLGVSAQMSGQGPLGIKGFVAVLIHAFEFFVGDDSTEIGRSNNIMCSNNIIIAR